MDYFSGEFMMDYRVADLEGLLAALRSEGIEIVKEVEIYDYGKFSHIIDGDGHNVELWEPVDDIYDDMVGDGRTK